MPLQSLRIVGFGEEALIYFLSIEGRDLSKYVAKNVIPIPRWKQSLTLSSGDQESEHEQGHSVRPSMGQDAATKVPVSFDMRPYVHCFVKRACSLDILGGDLFFAS